MRGTCIENLAKRYKEKKRRDGKVSHHPPKVVGVSNCFIGRLVKARNVSALGDLEKNMRTQKMYE